MSRMPATRAVDMPALVALLDCYLVAAPVAMCLIGHCAYSSFRLPHSSMLPSIPPMAIDSKAVTSW